MTRPKMIVFSDLDGTLLDHDTYSFDAALPALARLRALGVPLVLASSKTAAEIAPLRDKLGFSSVPAIVENGAGLLAPGDAPQTDDSAYQALRTALAEIAMPFQGFGDLGPKGIERVTGLPADDARLAGQRQFSEPGLWQGTDDEKAAFLPELAARGIDAREGGRFLTLSYGATKADQMAAIVAQYDAPFSMALGDAPNDSEMLIAADLGVIVANPHRAPLPQLPGEATGHITRTKKPGPEGWNLAVTAAIVARGLQ